VETDPDLPTIAGVVHAYDSNTPLPFAAAERHALDRGIGMAVGHYKGSTGSGSNNEIHHLHEPKHSLMPYALYTGSDDHLRRTGAAFAILDLEVQRRMALLVLGASGGNRHVFVRTAAVRGSHAVVNHGFAESGAMRSTAPAGSEGGGLDAAMNLTPCGDVVVLLRPTELGLAFAAAETGTPAQLSWNVDEPEERTGVPKDGHEQEAARSLSTRWLGRSHVQIDPATERKMNGERIGVPEATGGNGDQLLWWHTPYAAPYAPFTSARQSAALWRRFRLAPRRRLSALGAGGM